MGAERRDREQAAGPMSSRNIPKPFVNKAARGKEAVRRGPVFPALHLQVAPGPGLSKRC